MQKSNKRLYEDCIVKEIVKIALKLAIQKKITEKNIKIFVDEEFNNILKRIIEVE